jgi:hypothetical protein
VSPVPAAVTRQALTATLGAVAGVGLGLAALGIVRAGQNSERDDAGTRAAFAKFLAEGPEDGTWKIHTRDRERDLTLRVQTDPSKPGEVLVTNLDSKLMLPKPFSPDMLARRFAPGDGDLFFGSYVPSGPAVVDRTSAGGEVAMAFRRKDCSACARRTVYMDITDRIVTRIEDRDYRGELVQSASLVVREKSSAPRTPRPSAPRSTNFAQWVADQSIPVYEPARAPAGFRLVDWKSLAFQKADGARLRPLVLSYDDGVARIEILIASTEDMLRLDEFAREFQKAGPSTCPATSTDVPEQEVAGPHIKRRKDPCRTTLRREDLPQVVVMLVGFNEIPDHLYVETIQSLVLVSK